MSHRTLAASISRPAPVASTLAGSLVRDIVAALGALIAVVIVLLLIMNSRRRRAAAGSERPPSYRGQHGRRRTGPEPRPAPPPRSGQHPGPDQETSRSTRPQPPVPVSPSWPAPGGWQGGSVGEIAQPPATPARPAVTPVTRPTAAKRSGTARRSGAGMPSGPPWAPAAEPENAFGPLPRAPGSLFTPQPSGGIRVPPDVTVPPATTTVPPSPAAAQPGAFDPPVLPSSTDSSAWPPLFDYTAPSPPDQRGLGFAAAPVAAGWDLAATDVFPAATSGSPTGTDPDDDAPGASGS